MSEPPESPLPPEERAREICLRALERRMQSRRELERKLRQKGIEPAAAAAVLDRLTEVGLVDDLAFARMFVASRQRTRPRGRRALFAELLRKGVAAEVAEGVLDETLEEEDPVEAARRAVASRRRGAAGKGDAGAKRKAEQFLIRRGFSYEVVRRALADWDDGGAGDDLP